MADPDVDRALYGATREPGAWLDHADQLKRAADTLLVKFQSDVAAWIGLTSFDQVPPTTTDIASNSAKGHLSAFSLGGVYLMVAGYAIENLAKGLIVAVDKSEATVNWITRRHVSVELLGRAQVELVDGEPDLVERMSVRVQWAGRYPIPRRGSELAAARAGDLWQNVLRVSPNDGVLVDPLFDRMRSRLEHEVARASPVA